MTFCVVLCMSAVAQCLFRCVQCHLRGVVSGAEEVGDVQLATDDLVTLLALTLIRYVKITEEQCASNWAGIMRER